MIKNNKYLKELGIKDENIPSALIPNCDERKHDMIGYGFSTYEFFSLDYTFSILIYPRLCYFRDNCLFGYPMGMNKEQWLKIINDMILAFRLMLCEESNLSIEETKNKKQKISRGLKLFIKYYNNLWY